MDKGSNVSGVLIIIANLGVLGFNLGAIFYYLIAWVVGTSPYNRPPATDLLLNGAGNLFLSLVVLWQARDSYRRIRARSSDVKKQG